MKKAGKLLKNLLQKKIFYFVILGLGVICFSLHFTTSSADAASCAGSSCPGDPWGGDGVHAIYTVTPTSLIAGRPDAVLQVRGCNLHDMEHPANQSRNRYILRKDGGVEYADDIEADYTEKEGIYFNLHFDLSGINPGYYNLIHYYKRKSQCNPETWLPPNDNYGPENPDPTPALWQGTFEYHDPPYSPPARVGDYSKVTSVKVLVYEPSIVGWGWFGAATPGDTSCRNAAGQPFACGSPAWMSLNCLSDKISGTERNRCYDAVDNPAGVTYGLGLFYDADHFKIRGQSWLGIHSDNDSNPANNTAIGWVNFDPTISLTDLYDAVPAIPGTTATQARYNEDTGEVYGWARIQALQEDGRNTRCTSTARDWSTSPFTLPGSLNGTASRIVEAPDRSLHATWVGTDANQSVYYDVRVDGSWLNPLPVNLSNIIVPADTANSTPDIAIKSDGTVYVSYVNNSGIIRLFSCSSNCGAVSNWTHSDAVTAAGLTDQSMVVTKDTNRTIYIYYQQGTEVYVVTSADGQSWTVPVQISNPGNATNPRLAVDFQDNVHVVWQSGTDIYYRKYTNGADWSPLLTDPGTKVNVLGNSARPSIAVDPEANPHVVYETAPNIVYRKYTPTGGWYPEVVVTGGANDTHPVIAYGNDYRAHVLYQDDAHAPNNKILYTESTNGRDWSATRSIYDENTINQLSPDAIATKDNYIQVLFSRPGDWINHSVSTGTYGANCTDPTAGTDIAGTDWGWVSLRGGLGMCGAAPCATPQDYANALKTIGPGFRSCYACDEAAMTCKICEILDQTYDPPNPPRYACNSCGYCGKCSNTGAACEDAVIDCGGGGATCDPNKKCSRTGAPCNDGDPQCIWLEGEENECVPACNTCTTCNTWGVSIDGDLATGANFHGYGWSAGGTVKVDATHPAGSYNSGTVDAAYNLTLAAQCNSVIACVAGGWQVDSEGNTNFNTAVQLCGRDGDFGLPGGTLDGWGACQVRGAGAATKFFTKPVPASLTAGNYFISLKAVFDNAPNENVVIEVLDSAAAGNILYTLTSADLNNAGKANKSCTFTNELYLEPGNLFRFKSANDVDIEIDSFQVTSLPVSSLNCALNNQLTEVYVDEVGFGFMDYSNVSTLKPWVQTQYGNIYSRGSIGAGGGAPGGATNSTYLIGTPQGASIDPAWIAPIIRSGAETSFGLPGPSQSYRSPLGKIPYADLSKPAGSNPYSDRVIEFNKNTALACPENGSINWSQVKRDVIPPNGKGSLQKGIYHFGRRNEACNLVIDEEMELEDGNNKNGSGVFLIEGDLTIDNNIAVKDTGYRIQVISELASVGFIVKGNIKIKGTVTELVGAYAAIGCDPSGVPPDDGNCQGAPASHDGLFDTAYDAGSASDQLVLSGVVIAYKYDFGRSFSTGLEGSEKFINDGRVQANPPPGFVNIATATQLSAERPFDSP